jgi:hypothetical protein
MGRRPQSKEQLFPRGDVCCTRQQTGDFCVAPFLRFRQCGSCWRARANWPNALRPACHGGEEGGMPVQSARRAGGVAGLKGVSFRSTVRSMSAVFRMWLSHLDNGLNCGGSARASAQHGRSVQDVSFASGRGHGLPLGMPHFASVCCLLVLNLVSSTLSGIRQPRPRLRVFDVCGFV